MNEGGIDDTTLQGQTEAGCTGVCDCEPSETKVTAKKPRLQHLWTRAFARQLLAEFLGTGIIVGLGTGSVKSYMFGGALVGIFQVAAVWIIAVTIAIATAGPISGAHLNPAISLTFAIFRPCAGFGWTKVLPYVVAQICGAMFFSWTNLIMYSPLIVEFENMNNITRGEPESFKSAKAFGQYYE
jgi:glycerol uptake facilitator protein